MRVISWNINSIRKRMHLVQMLLEEYKPDALCLQEIKCQNDQFPAEFFYNMGYHSSVHGQKAYNGVAILTKTPVIISQRQFADIEDARFISIKYNDWQVVSVYVPNGQMVGTPAYAKQQAFMSALIQYRQTFASQKIIIAGDFNIAPEDKHADFALRSSFICDNKLRNLWTSLLATGFRDILPDDYTWYDYRWPKMGARIDNILSSHLVSENKAILAPNATVLNNYRYNVTSPSDHCPIMLDM